MKRTATGKVASGSFEGNVSTDELDDISRG